MVGAKSPVGKSVEWYTPKWVFDKLDIDFDLDPASPADADTFVPARVKYTKLDDGLAMAWFGRVFLNPPFGRGIAEWVRKMIAHGDGILLVFSRTDAGWFQQAMRAADSTLFINGRIQFVPGHENKHKVSRCGAGTAFFAFGPVCAEALERLQHKGFLVRNYERQL